jgi:hypothetical protein
VGEKGALGGSGRFLTSSGVCRDDMALYLVASSPVVRKQNASRASSSTPGTRIPPTIRLQGRKEEVRSQEPEAKKEKKHLETDS